MHVSKNPHPSSIVILHLEENELRQQMCAFTGLQLVPENTPCLDLPRSLHIPMKGWRVGGWEGGRGAWHGVQGLVLWATLDLKVYFVKFLFFGGSILLLFYSVGIMTSCNYIPHIMLNDVMEGLKT